ncbi:MAG TPA: AlpA family phage regulatory protein [Casimicrobiaceae bacterium]|jgi:predicted DNA-binding transcriptional regulator AlpA
MSTDTVVRLSALAVELQRSKTSIRNDVKAGRLPAPIRTGPRSIGWLRSEIDAHLEKLAAARSAQAGGAV